MTSNEQPSRNVPSCCPLKVTNPTVNGQVPINLFQRRVNQDLRGYGPRDWSNSPQEIRPEAPNLIGARKTLNWGGVSEDGVSNDLTSVAAVAQSSIARAKEEYLLACTETAAAILHLRHLWLTTSGNYTQKAKVVNRMLCFYLILMGIHIAELDLRVNQKLFEGLCRIILKPKSKTNMLIGVSTIAVLILALYLIGG